MIDAIIKFDINLISIVLLIILYFISKIKKEIFSFSSRLFAWIILVNIVGLAIEPITWLVDGVSGNIYYHIGYFSNFILIISAPILIGLWASYLDYKLFGEKKRVQKYVYYQIPTFIVFILLLVNFVNPVFFYIEQSTNIYYYGNLFFLRYVLTYMVFIRLIYLVLANRSKENYRVIVSILMFLILPAVGSLVQLVNTQLLFTWSSLALSVLVVYIFLETTSGNKDYLTKVYSRKILEEYLKSLIENQADFQVIMIDMDRFKDVNDLYGHQVGDNVLVEFASILQEVECTKTPFVSRLGGDEFLIVLESCTTEETDTYINQVKNQLKTNELLAQFPFLSFSSGRIQNDYKMTVDDILMKTDHLMYKEKNKTHKN
ncbi:GGDEF domain-containing protein [Peloplasma aerotolerans]|uniref:GGDEF domain-containing protein n=1 Tax=Peloplasma aerotolerans TaxID=3044389 RepID=A0AAW6U7I1_9MOLU|nr:GGDEF domain-containing protein [Mariniplasma sp. M4Ah]MDI6452735.1 GGDEF domain-containing protein [Mariniplasma sp. M4Ah]